MTLLMLAQSKSLAKHRDLIIEEEISLRTGGAKGYLIRNFVLSMGVLSQSL